MVMFHGSFSMANSAALSGCGVCAVRRGMCVVSAGVTKMCHVCVSPNLGGVPRCLPEFQEFFRHELDHRRVPTVEPMHANQLAVLL